jgi:hypothetical protein
VETSSQLKLTPPREPDLRIEERRSMMVGGRGAFVEEMILKVQYGDFSVLLTLSADVGMCTLVKSQNGKLVIY